MEKAWAELWNKISKELVHRVESAAKYGHLMVSLWDQVRLKTPNPKSWNPNPCTLCI
jgi:hypothetical protein